jgi:hypothetical protein
LKVLNSEAGESGMSDISLQNNEINASDAFSRQSVVFDQIYSGNTIINYKRERVGACDCNTCSRQSSILELNSGTGEDAMFFAARPLCACYRYIYRACNRNCGEKALPFQDRITTEYVRLPSSISLKIKGLTIIYFPTLAGLNCTGELENVLLSFDAFKTRWQSNFSYPPFCLWETLLVFKGKFRTAFRRFFSGKGRKARVEDTYFTCYYYRSSFIINALQKTFKVLGVEGLCTIVPPSYMEGFAEKHPAAYSFLKNKEDKLKATWPWKYMGDYFIITLQKK